MTYLLGKAAHGWLTLPCGVQIDVAAIDRPMVRAARRAVRKFIADNQDMPADELADETADLFSATLIRLGLRGWKGLGDVAGKPIGKPTTETVDAFLADPLLFDQADAAYVLPWAEGTQEKNGSSPSPNGISTGATRAKTIAGSPARRPKGSGAKNVRTARKSPKPTRAKASGTSSAG